MAWRSASRRMPCCNWSAASFAARIGWATRWPHCSLRDLFIWGSQGDEMLPARQHEYVADPHGVDRFAIDFDALRMTLDNHEHPRGACIGEFEAIGQSGRGLQIAIAI